MGAIDVSALLICFSVVLGGQAENNPIVSYPLWARRSCHLPASPRWWSKEWDRNTGRITISLPKARISGAGSQQMSTSFLRLTDAEIETEGMILKAQQVELRISTMEADIRGAHVNFDKGR
jgi:hypothetical protein